MKLRTLQALGILAFAAITLFAAVHRETVPIAKVRSEPKFQERLDDLSSLYSWKEAHEWYMTDKLYPDFKLNAHFYDQAAIVRDQLPPARERGSGRNRHLPLGDWEFVGPRNLESPMRLWSGPSPNAGRVNAVAWHPTDDDTLVVASRGGLFKTTDRGVSWVPLNDNWPSVMSSAIAIDPSNPDRMFGGTGDFPSDWIGQGAFMPSGGVMRTSNTPGFWWAVTPEQTGQGAIADIIIHPDSPSIVLAISSSEAEGTVRRSNDGGTTWHWPHVTGKPFQALPKGGWCDLEISIPNTRGARTIYLARRIQGPGIELWRSTDNGVSFHTLAGPPVEGTHYRRVVIASSPLVAARVYVMISGEAIFRTDDAGMNWTDITGDFDAWGYANYNFAMDVVLQGEGGSESLVLGQVGLYLCQNPLDDEGVIWSDLGLNNVEGPPGNIFDGSPCRLHCDYHVIERNPHQLNQAFIGSDGGAYLLTFPNSTSSSIENIGGALPNTLFHHASFHPTNPDVMMGGLQDNATASTSTSLRWGNLGQWDSVYQGDGCYSAINPLNPQIQYAGSQAGRFVRTKDAWASWDPDDPSFSIGKAEGGFIFAAPLELDRNHPDHLYVAGGKYVHRWDEATSAWSARVVRSGTEGENIRALHIPQGATQRIYMGTFDGRLYAGNTQTGEYKELTNTTTPKRSITDIHVHPSDLNSILVTFSGVGGGHVYRASLSGSTVPTLTATWEDRSGAGWGRLPDIPTNTIERDPYFPSSTWYVGTDVGVLMTTDMGATWKNATGILGMPNVEVRHLEYVSGTGFLNAATFGRGIYRLRLSPTILMGFYVGWDNISPTGGGRVPVRVLLNSAAPSGGAPIALRAYQRGRSGEWERTNLVELPESVLIPEGQSSFEIQANTLSVEKPVRVLFEVRLGSEVLQVEVDLLPPTFAVRVEPSDLLGGAPAVGRVDFESPAPAGGTRVFLSSSIGDLLTVPSEVNVPEGARFATFPVTTMLTALDRVIQVTATKGTEQRRTDVDLRALRVTGIAVDQSSIVGGGRLSGRVHLSGRVLGPVVVKLARSSPVVTVPEEVLVPVGASSVAFEIETSLVSAPVSVEISAELVDKVRASLTVMPRYVRGSVSYRDVRDGYPLTQLITVQLFEPGTGTQLDEIGVTPDPFGRFTVSCPALTEFDVSLKVSHWLRRTVPIRTGGGVDLAFDLYNGDVNGDNSVNVADFLALRSAFGTTRGSAGYNPMADLNEDGAVGIADFLVLRANFGSVGD